MGFEPHGLAKFSAENLSAVILAVLTVHRTVIHCRSAVRKTLCVFLTTSELFARRAHNPAPMWVQPTSQPKRKATHKGLLSFWLRRWDLNHMTSGLWARRATRLLYSAILFSVPWCRWPGSNRYDALASRDFKSRASACSATPAFRNQLSYCNTVFFVCQHLFEKNL